ncbi:hypothetical protein CYMTET_23881, partial [Cymbomonas tetramitiformis]
MAEKKGKRNSLNDFANKMEDFGKVTAARVASKKEYQEVDVAVVKATNHDDVVPKEKHVRTILASVGTGKPRAEVAYCIAALFKRLNSATSWLIAQKSLMVLHRLMREGGELAVSEMLVQQTTDNHLDFHNFKDETNQKAWDLSGWVRTYASYLDEKLVATGALGFDVELERVSGHSCTRSWNTEDLMSKLPKLQQLLRRMLGCTPEQGSAARDDPIIGMAVNLVVRESFKLYRAVFDGIINLIDRFFDMQRVDAMKALDIYKTSTRQATELGEMYVVAGRLKSCEMMQFPELELPDSTLFASMEEYAKSLPGGDNHKSTRASSTSRTSSTTAAPKTVLAVPLPTGKPSEVPQGLDSGNLLLDTPTENERVRTSTFKEEFDAGLPLECDFARQGSNLGYPGPADSSAVAAAPAPAPTPAEVDLLGGFTHLQVSAESPVPSTAPIPLNNFLEMGNASPAQPAAAPTASGNWTPASATATLDPFNTSQASLSPPVPIASGTARTERSVSERGSYGGDRGMLNKGMLDDLYNQATQPAVGSPFASFAPDPSPAPAPVNQGNPFGAQMYPSPAQPSNPFAMPAVQQTSPGTDPFAAPQHRPAASSDPFGHQRPSDPFMGMASQPTGISPVVPPKQQASPARAADPFADLGTPQPVVQEPIPMNVSSNDPFGMALPAQRATPMAANPFDALGMMGPGPVAANPAPQQQQQQQST